MILAGVRQLWFHSRLTEAVRRDAETESDGEARELRRQMAAVEGDDASSVGILIRYHVFFFNRFLSRQSYIYLPTDFS
jgi:hypothetical protein